MTATHTDTCRCCGTTVTWPHDPTEGGGRHTNMPADGNGLVTCDDCYDDATGYIHQEHP